jgi:hypothetical protein
VAACRAAGSACEAVGRLDEEFIGDVGSAVVFVFDYVQGGQRELSCEAPDHAERRCDVEPAPDEHRRNTGDAAGAPADAVRGEKGVLAEEVRHQAGEAEAKGGVGVAGARFRRPADYLTLRPWLRSAIKAALDQTIMADRPEAVGPCDDFD